MDIRSTTLCFILLQIFFLASPVLSAGCDYDEYDRPYNCDLEGLEGWVIAVIVIVSLIVILAPIICICFCCACCCFAGRKAMESRNNQGNVYAPQVVSTVQQPGQYPMQNLQPGQGYQAPYPNQQQPDFQQEQKYNP